MPRVEQCSGLLIIPMSEFVLLRLIPTLSNLSPFEPESSLPLALLTGLLGDYGGGDLTFKLDAWSTEPCLIICVGCIRPL